MPSSSPILLFLKAPVRGRVKTRLAAALGDDAALELYKNFVLDLLATIEQTGLPYRIFYYPADAGGMVADWLGPQRCCLPQEGNDLGERMMNAFSRVFADGQDRTVIIGSDMPDLPAPLLHEAMESLDTHECVIGPAADGGYYLIGFTRTGFRHEIFKNIAWSTNRVYDETLQRLRRTRAKVHMVPLRRDVDTIDDLRDLERRNAKSGAAPRTMALLAQRTP